MMPMSVTKWDLWLRVLVVSLILAGVGHTANVLIEVGAVLHDATCQVH